MIRRPPRSTQSRSSAASDVYKRQSVTFRGHSLLAIVEIDNAGPARRSDSGFRQFLGNGMTRMFVIILGRVAGIDLDLGVDRTFPLRVLAKCALERTRESVPRIRFVASHVFFGLAAKPVQGADLVAYLVRQLQLAVRAVTKNLDA